MSTSREMERVQIRADLMRVAALCGLPEGTAPNSMKYNRHGRFSLYRVKKRAGNPDGKWVGSVRAYGLTPAHKTREPKVRALVEDVRRVSRECGRNGEICTMRQYNERGIRSAVRVLELLGTWKWSEVAAFIGLKFTRAHHVRTWEEIVTDYKAVALEMGCPRGGIGPTLAEFLARVEYSRKAITSHAPFTALCRAAGYTPRPAKGGWHRRRQRERERLAA